MSKLKLKLLSLSREGCTKGSIIPLRARQTGLQLPERSGAPASRTDNARSHFEPEQTVLRGGKIKTSLFRE